MDETNNSSILLSGATWVLAFLALGAVSLTPAAAYPGGMGGFGHGDFGPGGFGMIGPGGFMPGGLNYSYARRSFNATAYSFNGTFAPRHSVNYSAFIPVQVAVDQSQATMYWNILNAEGLADPHVAPNLTAILSKLLSDNFSLSQYNASSTWLNFTQFERSTFQRDISNATRASNAALREIRRDNRNNVTSVNMTLLNQQIRGFEQQSRNSTAAALNSTVGGRFMPPLGLGGAMPRGQFGFGTSRRSRMR